MRFWNEYSGHSVRVSDERLAHLVGEHPEMAGQESLIEATLLNPDIVTQSDTDDQVKLYHRAISHPAVGQKYLVAVVKCIEDDWFLLTAHFTDKVKRGAILWTKR